jgi:HK97 family phage major capsid protein
MDLIEKAREQLGKALDAARTIAQKMKEEPEKQAELQESFDKAMADVKASKLSMQNAESQKMVEDEYKQHHEDAQRQTQHMAPTEKDKAEKKKEQHAKAYDLYLRQGAGAAYESLSDLSPQERNALLGTQGDLGGFLIPDDFRNELIRDVAGLSTFRLAGARTIPTSLRVLTMPTVTTGGDQYPTDLETGAAQDTGNWKGEGSNPATDGGTPAVQNKPTFGEANIPTHIWQPDAVVLTRELLDDSVVPLDSLIPELFAEILALDEDWAFTLGNGIGKPLGIQSAGLAEVSSGTKSVVTYGGLIDLMMTVPAQYRQGAGGVFMMNSLTFGEIVKLEDGGSTLIFPANALPGTLFSKRVVFNEFMPDIADNAEPIAFGDFSKYIIADRQDMRVQRLEEKFAPKVGIMVTARRGGQLVRLNCLRLQTIPSS